MVAKAMYIMAFDAWLNIRVNLDYKYLLRKVHGEWLVTAQLNVSTCCTRGVQG
jgi:hypothetical protein